MKYISVLSIILLLSSSGKDGKTNYNHSNFTERDVLEQLDLAFKGISSKYYPVVRPQDITYNFFPDLENGYCSIAGSRIHLYADSTRWAIVFETCGYHNRATAAEIELTYIGNCIDYAVSKYPERNYVSNTSTVCLIEPEEFERIQNKDGIDMENFELISQTTKEIKIRNQMIPFENNYQKYEQLGIKLRDYNNPKNLIGFEDLIRYLNETSPLCISASEAEIKQQIPNDIPKLMAIHKFHYRSKYDKSVLPSQQETYQLIAKVLLTKDTAQWKPTLKPNNHWSNWNRGIFEQTG